MNTGNTIFDVTLFGTDDLFQTRQLEEIVSPFMRTHLMRPTHYGTGDSDLANVSSLDSQDLAAFWKKEGFLFLVKKGEDIRYEVQLQNMIPGDDRAKSIFSTLGIRLTLSRSSGWSEYPENLRQLILELAAAYKPCYGCCYQIVGSQIIWNLKKQGVPDIFWLNIFGSPYVDIIGADKLNSTPFAKVELLNWGGILVETRNISLEQREIIKKHLGRRLFSGGAGLFCGIKVPQFDFLPLREN